VKVQKSTSTLSSRRQFLKQAGAVGAGAIAFPYIVPSSALGKDGAVAPSNRIAMGWIGTGGQGRGLMGIFMGFNDAQVVACCDVDEKHLADGVAAANEKYGNEDCAAFHDFRELVARKDIDAVVVATPDHWHAITSVAALDAGKDVYCEKPLANSIYESRKIVDAVKRNKRVLQTGSMERSNEKCRFAAELVRNGRIGKLKQMVINLPFTEKHLQDAKAQKDVPPPMPVPSGFDYNFWLGHTPEVPYTEKRCHFFWRFNLAYGGGEMTDRGAHVIDIGQMANNSDDTGPVEVEAKGVQNPGSIFNTFWDYHFTNKYANGVEMVGSTDEPRGIRFVGEDGWIFVHIHGGALEASKPDILKEKIAPNEINLGRAPLPHDQHGHRRQFLDCVKSRQQPFAHAEAGHRTASICHLNNIAMALGRKLKWDPKAEQFVGDDEANKMLKPDFRTPWTL
jgi:predicted dehydrogenase